MNKKSPIYLIISIIISIVLFWGSLALASPGIFYDKIDVIYKTSNNVFIDHLELNQIKVAFKSSKNLRETTLISSCDIHSKFLVRQDDIYVFELKYFADLNCDDTMIYLNDGEENFYYFNVNILSESQVISKFIDYNDTILSDSFESLESKIKRFLKYEDISTTSSSSFIAKNRTLKELEYTKEIVGNIITKRSEKYSVPVEGYTIDQDHAHNKIPNAGRPYRAWYTDGIHHGWDVGTKLWEEIIALDDGIIVRVVDDFSFSDFSRVKYATNLSEEDKIKNLDILRWNQVWLKTMKWDVVFYSHLNNVYTHIKEGTVIWKGEPVWTIWITGVPDKNYKDYHLHFTIHKNPYTKLMAGKYGIDDYMKWPWYFQGDSKDEILKAQTEIFDSPVHLTHKKDEEEWYDHY